jgi:hypothetical protein
MNAPSRRARSTSYLRLVPVPQLGSLHVRFFDAEILGILTHHLKRKGKPEPRSYACRGDGCKMCKRTFPELQWKGYLCAEWLENVNGARRWIPCVFEVTEHAEQEMRAHYRAGAVFEFWREYREDDAKKRERKQERGACCCKYRGQTPAAELVEPWPVDKVLFNVFRIRGLVPHLKSTLEGLEPINPRAFIKAGDAAAPPPPAAPASAPEPQRVWRPGERESFHAGMRGLGYEPAGQPRSGPFDAEDAERCARNELVARAASASRNGTH